MPSSTWHNMETFVEVVWTLKPSSFLDIGVGNGKWGFLFREYTDIWQGRFLRSQWTSIVEGIEIYEPYIRENLHQLAIYNQIHLGDATQVVNGLGSYDVVYAGDVLEHIAKEASLELLQKLIRRAKMAMICSVPLGENWLCTSHWDNTHEDHVSVWSIDDLIHLGFAFYSVTRDPATGTRPIGFFVHSREDLRISGLKRLRDGWFPKTFLSRR